MPKQPNWPFFAAVLRRISWVKARAVARAPRVGDVHGDGGSRLRLGACHLGGATRLEEFLLGGGSVEAPGGALGGVQQNDAGAGVPALELAGLERVVGEEEVLHGVHLVAGATLCKGVGVAAGAHLVGGRGGTPLTGIHHSKRRLKSSHSSSLNDAAYDGRQSRRLSDARKGRRRIKPAPPPPEACNSRTS